VHLGSSDEFAQIWVSDVKVPEGTVNRFIFNMTGTVYSFTSVIKDVDVLAPVATDIVNDESSNADQALSVNTPQDGALLLAAQVFSSHSGNAVTLIPPIQDVQRDIRTYDFFVSGSVDGTSAETPRVQLIKKGTTNGSFSAVLAVF
jgi:hypothetical protein